MLALAASELAIFFISRYPLEDYVFTFRICLVPPLSRCLHRVSHPVVSSRLVSSRPVPSRHVLDTQGLKLMSVRYRPETDHPFVIRIKNDLQINFPLSADRRRCADFHGKQRDPG